MALASPSPGEEEFESWLSEGDVTPIDVPVTLDDVALILYTSGTTGRPKGATLTHANLVWNSFNVMIGVDEVTLISAPLVHVAALNQTLLPTFLKGACSVIMPSWSVEECYGLIEKYGITWMFGVTAMFAAFARSPRWPAADLSCLRHLMAGGAAIPASLIRTYQARGLVFCQGWDPEATAAAFSEGGWFHSGDIATLDDEGHLHIVDRVKDMYISGGENVYPAEVESVLFEHPAVAEVAVVGVPDAQWGEVGRAFVVRRPAVDVTEEELRGFLLERLAKYKIPRYFELVNDLPRTGSGKIHKPGLRGRALP